MAIALTTIGGLAPASPVAAAVVVYNGAGSAPRIGIIGDSAFAGIAVAGTFDPIKQYNFVYDAVACRRTILASCSTSFQSTPANAISVLRARAGQWGSLLVMATGYNDPGHNFDEAVDAIMAEAARQGIPTVMWMTLRTAPMAFVPLDYESTSTSFRDNNLILLQKAAQYGGRLQIADWVSYASSHPDWFTSDGIHFRPAGAVAAAQFLASSARRVLNGESITPTRDGLPPPGSVWTHLRRGMGGTAVASLQQILIAEGIPVAGGVTGVFNDGTLYAVQTFQRLHRLPPYGIVDEATARALGMLAGTWRSVGRGATGSTVTRLQTALINRGIFVRGGATGVFDIYTMYAVQTYQRRQDLRVSGVVDADTARALGLIRAPHPSAFWIPLSRGSTGLNVARAQQALMNRGVFVRGGATGVFDLYTLYAVNTFQRYNGLTVSGVIDVETAYKLGLFNLANPVATWTNLALGSTGPRVRKAEQLLAYRRIYLRDGVDGIFKLGDYYAVCTFQRYNGLTVTGVIDLRTAIKLGMFNPLPAGALSTATLAAVPAAPTTTTTSTTSTTTTTTTTTPTTTTTTTTTSTLPPTSTTTPPDGDVVIRVWFDSDADGLADTDEPATGGVRISLRDAAGAEIAVAVTDAEGEAIFDSPTSATFTIEAIVPSGLTITLADQLAPGLDAEQSDTVDSDFVTLDVLTAIAQTHPLTPAAVATATVGLGLVAEPGLPTTTTTTTSTSVPDSTTTPTTAVPTTAVPTTVAPTSTTEPPTSTTSPPTTVPSTPPPQTTTLPPATTLPAETPDTTGG